MATQKKDTGPPKRGVSPSTSLKTPTAIQSTRRGNLGPLDPKKRVSPTPSSDALKRVPNYLRATASSVRDPSSAQPVANAKKPEPRKPEPKRPEPKRTEPKKVAPSSSSTNPKPSLTRRASLDKPSATSINSHKTPRSLSSLPRQSSPGKPLKSATPLAKHVGRSLSSTSSRPPKKKTSPARSSKSVTSSISDYDEQDRAEVLKIDSDDVIDVSEMEDHENLVDIEEEILKEDEAIVKPPSPPPPAAVEEEQQQIAIPEVPVEESASEEEEETSNTHHGKTEEAKEEDKIKETEEVKEDEEEHEAEKEKESAEGSSDVSERKGLEVEVEAENAITNEEKTEDKETEEREMAEDVANETKPDSPEAAVEAAEAPEAPVPEAPVVETSEAAVEPPEAPVVETPVAVVEQPEAPVAVETTAVVAAPAAATPEQPKRSAQQPAQANNDVIEETTSKLMQKRKNKVLALVGAFETVISLQEPEA